MPTWLYSRPLFRDLIREELPVIRAQSQYISTILFKRWHPNQFGCVPWQEMLIIVQFANFENEG